MTYWEFTWMVLGVVFSCVSFFPLVKSSHWFFRLFDFARIQLLAILIILLIFGFFTPFYNYKISIYILILTATAHQLLVLYPYFPKHIKQKAQPKNSVKTISVNVKQDNNNYKKLIELVKNKMPDLLLTMETNNAWEEALSKIENRFKHSVRVPQENRYGMHLYSNLTIKYYNVHYLISKEHPSIEACLIDKQNNEFILWGIHPPPPSPTEKPTSKQKDAELLKVAQLSLKTKLPLVVIGDFNNVCWSRTSKLFVKTSKLIDARINKGFYSTFPANLSFLRFPIDLFYHSQSISSTIIKVLPSIGSDHLPLLTKFHVNNNTVNKVMPNNNLKKTTNRIIKEGKKAAKIENIT